MIDGPITELLDDSIGLIWLGRPLHPAGLSGPRCGSRARRLFRPPSHVPASRGRGWEGSYTLRPGTVFAKPRPRPATVVLLLRGMVQGEPTARLARALGLSRKHGHALRPRVRANLHATAPTDVRRGTAVEADERDQDAGGKRHPLASRHAAVPSSTRGMAPEWQRYRGRHPCHATVHHGGHEWAREDDRDGRRGARR